MTDHTEFTNDELRRLTTGVPMEERPRTADLATFALRMKEERDRALAECAAFVGALDEWGRWPDLPNVPYAVRLKNPETGDTETLALHPDQIEGLARAIRQHGRTMLAFGAEAVDSHYRSSWFKHRIALLEEQLDHRTTGKPMQATPRNFPRDGVCDGTCAALGCDEPCSRQRSHPGSCSCPGPNR